MKRKSARLSIVVLTLFLVASLFSSQSIVEAQGGCTSQQVLQADRLLRDAQDALGNGNVADALQALQDAEAILQACSGGAAPTLAPTRAATAIAVTGTTKSFVGSKSGIKFNYPNRSGWLVVDLTTRVVASNNAGAAVSLLNNERPRAGEMWVFVSIVTGRTTSSTVGTLLESTIKQAFAGKKYTKFKSAQARSGNVLRQYVYSDLTTEDKRIIMFPAGPNSIGLMIVNAKVSEMARYVPDLNVIIATVVK